MPVPPTHEQKLIIEAARRDANIAINAFAGTGKTTTLSMIAHALPRKRILYLAFNRAIAQEAKERMPSNVDARTFHSLAFRAMRPDTNRLERRMHGGFVADEIGVAGLRVNGAWYYSSQVGRAVLATVSRYCISSAPSLAGDHVPPPSEMLPNASSLPESVREMFDKSGPERDEYTSYVLDKAKLLWERMSAPESNFPMSHDTYVKQWVLKGPRIDADVVLFDEAQDASSLFIDIVSRQRHAQRIWVGDSHQQIYAWRDAVNALQRVKVDEHLYLTESWRFGDNIAAEANVVLKTLKEERALKGRGGEPKALGKAILCRTNLGAFEHYVKHAERGEIVRLENASDLITLVDACEALQRGEPREALALFKSWDTLMEHVESPQGRDLRPLVEAVQTHGCSELRRLLQAGMVEHAPWTISTIHRAKGLEWDEVDIIGDWGGIKNYQQSPDELRLLYVALTRARMAVKPHALITEWLSILRNGPTTTDTLATDIALSH